MNSWQKEMDEVRRQGHQMTINQFVKGAKVGTIDKTRQVFNTIFGCNVQKIKI